jgi:WASH complex subunit 7
MYPFDRAEDFNKNIKRLGTFEGGATYLDKFR